jgi:Metallo-beta-lactamase superfamily
MQVQRIGDVTMLRDKAEIPGLGVLPINAFVLHAEQPMLIDTGMPVSRPEFLAALASVIDLTDLRWIWLSHPDRDHMGSLFDVLAAAPAARLVTTFAAMGYLGTEFDVPLPRVYLLNPGQSLDLGDRRLHAFRPPLFDSPMTVGFFDDKTGTCFSSDCFGGPMPTVDDAGAGDLGDLDPETVRAAQLLWVGVDSPWVRTADPVKFAASYEQLLAFRPQLLFSSHLPPLADCLEPMVEFLAAAPSAPEFVGPDQAALEAILGSAHPIDLPEQAAAPAPI